MEKYHLSSSIALKQLSIFYVLFIIETAYKHTYTQIQNCATMFINGKNYSDEVVDSVQYVILQVD